MTPVEEPARPTTPVRSSTAPTFTVFPFELTYIGAGIEFWREPATPRTREAEAFLGQHAEALLALVPALCSVEVIDLGPGSTRPVHGLLRHLLDHSRFDGYLAIDISEQMLELARQNLRAASPKTRRVSSCVAATSPDQTSPKFSVPGTRTVATARPSRPGSWCWRAAR